ncbi:hypothetical protein [Armatimonas sp.]|uniref:hypothetical protein n=1 Tax=Armatimonas sp. TaxID=1872638 RepID=UPI003750DF66
MIRQTKVGVRPELEVFTRRQVLQLCATSGIALALPGCGGGGGDSGGGGGAGALARTKLTGDLRNQIEQFNAAVEQVGLGWQGSSPACDAARSFLNSPGHGRGPVDAIDAMRGVSLVMDALKDTYQRTAQMGLKLDDMGHVGDSVTTANSLVGDSSLSNPQYMMAMLDRHYHMMKALCGIQKTLSVAGIQPLINLVRATTDPYERVVGYSILADTFNTWVGTLLKTSNKLANPSLLLALDSTINPETIEAQIARIPGIVSQLPMPTGPPHPTRSPLDYNHLTSYLGTFADLYLTLPADTLLPNFFTATEKFSNGIRRLASDFRTNPHIQTPFLQGASKAAFQDLAFNWAGKALEFGIGGTNGINARCTLELGKAAFETITMGVAAVGTSVTFVGGVVYGALAANSAYSFYTAAQKCEDDLLKEQARLAAESLRRLDESYRVDGNLPAGRGVTIPPSGIHEHDQIRALQTWFRSAKFPQDFDFDRITIDPEVERGTLNAIGGGSGGDCEAAEKAFLKLMVDFMKRNRATINPIVVPETNVVSYVASQFSVLVTREPGATQLTVPAITDAQLLCTAKGFIPRRGSVDLTTIPAMPSLGALPVTFGLGVKIHAK